MSTLVFLIRASSLFYERFRDTIHQNSAILGALIVVIIVAVA